MVAEILFFLYIYFFAGLLILLSVCTGLSRSCVTWLQRDFLKGIKINTDRIFCEIKIILFGNTTAVRERQHCSFDILSHH